VIRNLSFEMISVDNTKQVAEVQGIADSLISDVRFDGLSARHYNVGVTCGNATGIVILNSNVPVKGCSPQGQLRGERS